MTEEEAKEIMMLVEDYGVAEYAKAASAAFMGESSEGSKRNAQEAWDGIWAKLKEHIKEN